MIYLTTIQVICVQTKTLPKSFKGQGIRLILIHNVEYGVGGKGK